MNVSDILNIIIAVVFIGVGIALVVFVIELIRTVKTARTTIDDIKKQVDPLLTEANTAVNSLQPAIAKVDPLIDRVQLTVDSVNLEMMRVDQILEDVSEITDTAASATAAVDNIANAPLKAVNSVATKFKEAFGPKDASSESEQLAAQREAVMKALEERAHAQEKEEEQEKIQQNEAQAERTLNLDGYLSYAAGVGGITKDTQSNE